jgi:hypothetical protein
MLYWVWVHFEAQGDGNITIDRFYKIYTIIKPILGSERRKDHLYFITWFCCESIHPASQNSHTKWHFSAKVEIAVPTEAYMPRVGV